MASISDEDVEDRFSNACSYVQSNAQTFERDQLLLFYGFYKQSTVGMCNSTSKPSWYEMEAKQKWNAWNRLGEMSSLDSMMEYVSLLSKLRPCWEESDSKDKPGWVSVSCMAQDEDQIDEDDKTIFDHVKDGNIAIVQKMVKSSTIDKLDECGMGLIHWAADRGNISMVRCLLDLKACVDLLDDSGQTALHYASACGHSEVIKLLLDHGASSSVKCSEGFSPADVAMSDEIRTLITEVI